MVRGTEGCAVRGLGAPRGGDWLRAASARPVRTQVMAANDSRWKRWRRRRDVGHAWARFRKGRGSYLDRPRHVHARIPFADSGGGGGWTLLGIRRVAHCPPAQSAGAGGPYEHAVRRYREIVV